MRLVQSDEEHTIQLSDKQINMQDRMLSHHCGMLCRSNSWRHHPVPNASVKSEEWVLCITIRLILILRKESLNRNTKTSVRKRNTVMCIVLIYYLMNVGRVCFKFLMRAHIPLLIGFLKRTKRQMLHWQKILINKSRCSF